MGGGYTSSGIGKSSLLCGLLGIADRSEIVGYDDMHLHRLAAAATADTAYWAGIEIVATHSEATQVAVCEALVGYVAADPAPLIL